MGKKKVFKSLDNVREECPVENCTAETCVKRLEVKEMGTEAIADALLNITKLAPHCASKACLLQCLEAHFGEDDDEEEKK